MFDEWAKNIASANQFDSGNIYQNYATAGVTNASPEATAGRKAVIQSDIDAKNLAESKALAKAKKDMEDKFESDKTDPSKARMELNEDGSYTFLNGIGQRLNINQFSLLTGKRPDELLADSENPDDQKFVQDYKTMRDFSTAWVNGDNATLQKMRAADPEKYNQLISTYKTPGEMVNGFRDYYSKYYSSDSTKAFGAGPASTFSPGQVTGMGDDDAGKRMASQLLSSPLSETLSPVNLQEERPEGLNFLTAIPKYGPFAGLGGGWGWGPEADKVKAYDEKLKTNPWMAYRNYLRGD